MTYRRKETIGDATHRVRIYALCGPDDAPRYVGKTVQQPHERFKAHMRLARKESPRLPVHRWMAKMEREGRPFTIIHLEYIDDGSDWQERERYWINRFRDEGRDILNLTDGGEGLHGHKLSEAHKQKIADALRKGRTFNCDNCGSEFYRKPKDSTSKNLFCSRECYAKSQSGVSRPMPRECNELGVSTAAAAKRAMTHCKRGHELSGENLFITSQGSRGCKECRKIHKRAHRERSRG